MKLKFRAEPKDIAVFLLFSLFLLYLVCLIILNLSSLAQNGTFAGFNPLPAFEAKYVIATLVLYVIILIVIITSVTSHFYEMEKGVGFSTSPKKEKNYSRWLTTKEMKKVLKMVRPSDKSSQYAGIPLINNGKEMWVDNGEYHNLIIGSTGSGKTEMLVQPMVKSLAKKGESMIITDPKGEIYENNAVELREKGYNIVLLNFRDPQKGNSWNPLGLPYSLFKAGNQDKANELLDDLAMNILYDEKSSNADPFWEKTSADYFCGLALALFDDATEDQINLNSINLMTTIGEEKFAGSTYVKEYFNTKDPASPAYVNASSTLMAPSDTKGSILSVFKQKVKLFTSRQNLSEMLSHSDFDMKDIGRKKTAVFLVIQDEKKTYHSLVTIFIKQCYETLIDVAQESGGKLPYRTNFILDEFANMPPLKDVTTMVTAARSRNIRFNFIIQNYAQLSKVYGKEEGDTIKGNCGNIIYLISSEIAALEEISKMCGEVKSKEKEKTSSMPLVTVSDLQRLPQWTMIILRLRMMPFKTKMKPNWQMEKENLWGIKYPKANYPMREKREIHLFDIKGYVQKAKEESINRMMNGGGSGGSSPFGGSPFGAPAGGSSPFGGSPFGGSPFGGSPFGAPAGGSSPFGGNASNNSAPAPKTNSFDVDDLVKRIDAKIAELEAEEEKEKQEKAEKEKLEQAKEQEPVSKVSLFDDDDDILIGKDKTDDDSLFEEENKPKSDNNGITDDQFFDDFFSDD